MADFSTNLKRHRQAGGMSQAQLAEKMNVTRQTVSSWERGNSYPDIGSLTRLAEVLGVEVQMLLCPPGRKRFGKGELTALTPKFWMLSMLFYIPLFLFGAVYVAEPLYDVIGDVTAYSQPFIWVFWGLFLVIAFVGLCTCIITEYIANAVEILSADRESAE